MLYDDNYPRKDKDEGCKQADDYLGEGKKSSCLNCPFFPSPCVEDKDFRYINNLKMQQRDAKIIELWKKGTKIKDIIKTFGLSRRTVYRVIRRR